ncbi:PR-1 class pathogen-related protein [Fusarium heterosporum]|uniref:PR-1 class pathogen-related protein n=1 Tax=Fusarium heterosporum TaxID=42747 RepID=A0A8H5SWS3_FUSHE|nr:PR-1 class pathogen-related protein [Fusarium heterosporum]
MHFSTIVMGLMASAAIAAPHPNPGYEVVTKYTYVTKVVNAPQQTNVAQQPSRQWWKQPKKQAAAPQPTYVAQEPETEEPEAEPSKAPSSGSGSGSGSSSLTSDQQKAVDLHNEARKAVGNGPLEWDDSLLAGAQEWADHIASLGSLTHSQGEDGENLYMGTTSTPLADAVEAFLSEKSLYKGEAISGSNYMGFGHYTQCVWKSTTKVAMAVSKGSDGASYVVARYQEPGNMIGSKPY